ncbi:MAG: ribonuclease HI [Chloroflexi bacterium AL-N10]|nr:ribonuclease HI [Chloroflexi bacterium AL-N1]NOK66693.1 ribonuclease HI [Chloroflexi bacterium AL-N10]NOK72081.1 ribonuclease HI [Chloroflexi bacterium AL-N5]
MAKRKVYAIVKGQTPGLYDEWFGTEGAETQIKGFPGAVYKSFATLVEAQTWYTERTGQQPERYGRLASQPVEQEAVKLSIDPAAALKAGKTVIFTDGACEGNPGPGGYGVVLLRQDRKELSNGFARTTNNRMELLAAIVALKQLTERTPVVLYSDSSYVVNGIQKGWALKWRKNGWQRTEKGNTQPVKNADLWQQLLALSEQHDVEFVRVPGHAGVPENERCDRLAVAASRRSTLMVDRGFEEG